MTQDANPDDELEALRAEVERLRQAGPAGRARRRRRLRTAATALLTVLAVVTSALALLALWTFRTFTDTDAFVARVGPIIEQPAVGQAIGEEAAAQLVDAVGLEDRLRARLPDDVAVVAGPLTGAAQSYLAEAATSAVASDAFQQAWTTTLRQGHRLTIAVLSGDDNEAVQTASGAVVLNLTPVVNSVVAQGAQLLSDLLGRDITAPTVDDESIQAAVEALEQQLGVDLPAEFGQVVLFESDDLAAAQAGYDVARTAVALAPVAALLLIALAVVASTRRLRTLLVIVVGVAVLLLFVSLALDPLQQGILDRVGDAGFRSAVGATFDTVLSSLLTGIAVTTVLGVLAALGLFLLGRSRPARVARDAARQAPRLAATHKGPFLLAGAAVALLLLAVIPGRSWAQFLTVAVLAAAYSLAVLLAETPDDADESDEPALVSGSAR